LDAGSQEYIHIIGFIKAFQPAYKPSDCQIIFKVNYYIIQRPDLKIFCWNFVNPDGDIS